MANHRAERDTHRRDPSAGTATRSLRITRSAAPASQPGKRAARPTTSIPVITTVDTDAPNVTAASVAPVTSESAATDTATTVVVPGTASSSQTTKRAAPAVAGKRKAAPAARKAAAPSRKAAPAARASTPAGARVATPAVRPRTSAARGTRVPQFMGLPSLPMVAGVAALAVSAGGAISASSMTFDSPSTTMAATSSLAFTSPAAAAGADETAAALLKDREEVVSRDSRREAEVEKTQAELVAEAEAAAAERSETLETLAVQAEKQAEKIEANLWVMPVSGYRLTATYGLSSSLWSSVHTGLDFAAPSGTPLVAVANGTVTEVGYDGSYGNKVVLSLEDGTEVWYCHLSSFGVSVGQQVTGGDYLGGVGSTGNSTGSHLHLEIRPGGGNPVDPYSALLSHGLQP